MTKRAQLPDGTILEFPDETPDDVMDRAVRSHLRPQSDFSQVSGSADTVPGQKPRGVADSIGREFGLGARSMLQGVGSTLGIVTDPIAAGAGKALNAAFPQRQSLSGLITGEQPQERRFATAREGASALADLLRLPTPETGSERVGGQITEALSGGGGVMALGRQLATRGGGMVSRGIGEFLSSMPRTQIASLVGGSGAAGVTRESGGGQGAQLAAGLIGGLSPAVGSATIPATLRALFRGGEAGRQKMVETINDFRSIGAQPSVGQATGNGRTQGLESLLAGGPTSMGVMGRFAERQSDDIGAGLGRRADGFMPNASAERAGRAVADGVNDGFVPQTRAVADRLYATVDETIPAGSRVEVASTRQALADLNASIEGAPNVAKFFQNARIQGIEGALAKDTGGVAAVLSRPGVREQADELRGRLTQQAREQEQAYAQQVAQVEAENARLRLVGQPGQHPIPQKPAIATAKDIDGQVNEMLGGMVDNKLPYEALAKLRTLVGNEIDNYSLIDNVPRSKWKALYGALSRDMEAAATTPEAKAAWQRANSYYNARVRRLEAIDHVIKANGGAEKVFSSAMAGTRDGGTTLRAVMQSLPEDGQRAVTAAFVKRLGLATPGQQNATGEVFSAGTFMTNWNRVSPEARRALFDRHGPKFVADMEKIARVAERIKQGSKVFANPSGTTNRAAAYTYGTGVAGAAVATPFVGPGPLAGLVLGGLTGNAAARLMTNPRFVDWLARSSEMPASALPQQAVVLRQIAEGDPEIAEAARELQGAQQQ